MLSAMDDLGAPSSYLALADGVSVYSSDGEELGKVEHLLADPDEDIFDGFVIDTSVLPGGHRFVDAPEVEAIFERGVVLKLDAAAARELPEPSANPGVLEAGGDDAPPSPLQQKLGRAWDRISGNY
jgi:PRC-barrel domain